MSITPSNPNSTSPVEWALAFADAFPDVADRVMAVSLWFDGAIEAGYNAAEHGFPLNPVHPTEPPSL